MNDPNVGRGAVQRFVSDLGATQAELARIDSKVDAVRDRFIDLSKLTSLMQERIDLLQRRGMRRHTGVTERLRRLESRAKPNPTGKTKGRKGRRP